MSYPHEVVIDDVGKMVSRVAITLHDHLIVDTIIIKDNFAVNHVLEFRLALGDKHPNDIRFPRFHSLPNILFVEAAAKAVILCRLAFLTALIFAHLLQTIYCAEAVVG